MNRYFNEKSNYDKYPVAFTPFMIHPEKHFAPILCLSSACSCMKVDWLQRC